MPDTGGMSPAVDQREYSLVLRDAHGAVVVAQGPLRRCSTLIGQAFELEGDVESLLARRAARHFPFNVDGFGVAGRRRCAAMRAVKFFLRPSGLISSHDGPCVYGWWLISPSRRQAHEDPCHQVAVAGMPSTWLSRSSPNVMVTGTSRRLSFNPLRTPVSKTVGCRFPFARRLAGRASHCHRLETLIGIKRRSS